MQLAKHRGLFARFNGESKHNGNGRAPILPGQRFYSTNAPRTIWEVRRVFKPKNMSIVHAEIVAVDGEEHRVISEKALLDRAFFAPDRRDPSAINLSAHHRRRHDPLTNHTHIVAAE